MKVGGAEHLGVAVQGHGDSQKLVDHGLTALYGEISGDGLATLQLMIGQHLEAGVGAAGAYSSA